MQIRDWIAGKILGQNVNDLRNQLKVLRARGINYIEAITEPGNQTYGVGPDWSQTVYGEYYIKSVPIYAAISKRANALIRAPLKVYKTGVDEEGKPTKKPLPDHDLQKLLDKVNPFWTGLDLQRATETYLGIWGASYWILIKPGPGSPPTEIWPARPDKIRIIPDKTKYIGGFVYDDGSKKVSLLPDEVVWMRYFNPLSELGALAPVAVARLSADMGIEALKSNRNLFKNGMLFGNVGIELENTATDPEIEDFYKRLKKRFSTPENAYRPIVMSPGMKAKNLGFAPKEMEHLSNLRWSLEDVSRVWDVPKILLQDLENSTYSNMDAAERMFWRNTIIPEMQFLQAEIQEMLVSQFKEEGLIVEYDLSQLEILKEDFNALALRQREDVKVGLITINEARAERNLKPVPWGDEPPAPAPAIGMSLKELGNSDLVLRTSHAGPDGYRLYNPPALTDQAIERAGLVHIKRLDRFERRFKSAQTELFEKQAFSVLKNLKKTQKSIEKQAGQTLFNPEEWLEDFIDKGKPIYAGAIQEAADAQIAQYGLGISFDLKHPLVQEWLTDRVKFWAGRVNEETGRLLMQEIVEANNLGESIRDIQARVEKVFRFSDSIRSERIARTEMQSAINRGTVESYRQSGVVEQKVWLAVRDERTREAHLEAHMQTVPMEANFFVGGEYVFQPGEGSASQVINCRCTLVPIIKEGAKIFQNPLLIRGGEGSGNHDHAGRPGEQGGSAPGGGSGGQETARSRRAKISHKTSTAAVQRQAESNEPKLASVLGGKQTSDNEAFDVVFGNNVVEVKTIVRGKNDKITMHPESLSRKWNYVNSHKGMVAHTVVFDDRVGQIYYKEGLGSFRLANMQNIGNLNDLKGVIKSLTISTMQADI